MARDIRQLADSCKTCKEMKPRNTQEPLKQHNDGDGPWQKISLGLFEITGKHYLIVVDYYSNFIEIDLLTNLTSIRTIYNTTKKTFCAIWHTKGDRFRRRPTIYQSGIQFISDELRYFSYYLISNASMR